jgi:hypothetical protein
MLAFLFPPPEIGDTIIDYAKDRRPVYESYCLLSHLEEGFKL